MTTIGWIIAGIALLVAGAACLEAFLKRNRRRPLAKFHEGCPESASTEKELGLEATDVDLVNRAHRENQRTERYNARLSGRR
jgi:hypothetical protein